MTLLSFLKVQRYVFLGELPENLREAKENGATMIVAMVFLAVLCLLMSLLILVPSLREAILQPAVDVLVKGVGYSRDLIAR